LSREHGRAAAHPGSAATRALLRAGAVLLGAGGALWLATLGLVVAAGERAQLRAADAILVLGAAQYNGRPSPVFRARLEHAVDLYDRGLAPVVIFTGGVGVGDTLSEAEVGRRFAVARGVPDSAILVERQGTTSAESVQAAAVLLRARGVNRALVVSDPFHMLRLDLLARRAGIRPYRAPTPASPISQSPQLRWRYTLRESIFFPVVVFAGGR
jgi:uncharacterized SAM-binding protein YcdF (DUF218 family)